MIPLDFIRVAMRYQLIFSLFIIILLSSFDSGWSLFIVPISSSRCYSHINTAIHIYMTKYSNAHNRTYRIFFVTTKSRPFVQEKKCLQLSIRFWFLGFWFSFFSSWSISSEFAQELVIFTLLFVVHIIVDSVWWLHCSIWKHFRFLYCVHRTRTSLYWWTKCHN